MLSPCHAVPSASSFLPSQALPAHPPPVPGPLSPWFQPRLSPPDPDTRPQPHLHVDSGSAMLSCRGGSGFKIDRARPVGLGQVLQGHSARNPSHAVDHSVLPWEAEIHPSSSPDSRKLREGGRCTDGEARLECELGDRGLVLPPSPPSAPRACVRAQ